MGVRPTDGKKAARKAEHFADRYIGRARNARPGVGELLRWGDEVATKYGVTDESIRRAVEAVRREEH